MEKNQEKISRLVLDMLTFSKERQPEMVEAQLNCVVDDVVELMQARAQEAHVTVEFEPDRNLPELTFDPEGMHHAMLNVLTNAIDACAENETGRVSIAASFDEETGRTRVEFSDDGKGIPTEDLQRVFNFFVSNKGTRGTGLGLSVSQKILREHGGDIELSSEVGRGSTFALVFPTSTQRAEDATVQAAVDYADADDTQH